MDLNEVMRWWVVKGVVLLAAVGSDAYQKNIRATKARQSD